MFWSAFFVQNKALENDVAKSVEDGSEAIVDDVAKRVNSVIIRIEKEVIKEKLGVDVDVDNDAEVVVANIDANDSNAEQNNNETHLGSQEETKTSVARIDDGDER